MVVKTFAGVQSAATVELDSPELPLEQPASSSPVTAAATVKPFERRIDMIRLL